MSANNARTSNPTIAQAEGVLAAHLDVPIEEAARIIRTSAKRRDVPVGFVAGELVAPITNSTDAPL